jgi:long-subunit acyl-CoA synthetase (AMP-forming)
MALLCIPSSGAPSPKGVCITHASLIALALSMSSLAIISPTKIVSSFIYVLEYIVELVMTRILVGMPCGYGRGHWQDSEPQDPESGTANSIMVGVPAVCLMGIVQFVAKVNSENPIMKAIHCNPCVCHGYYQLTILSLAFHICRKSSSTRKILDPLPPLFATFYHLFIA